MSLLGFLLLLHVPIGLAAQSKNSSSTPAQPEKRQGWTSQPRTRGTIDILWECLFTMFLCSWAILCMNVPPQGERTIYRWRRKFYLTCLTLLAPEWTLQVAVGQWLHARRSVRKFKAADIGWWTMKHGFFANMGGFMLQAKDFSNDPKGERNIAWKSFPINSDQLLYLIKHGYIEPPKITKKGITEKDKIDGAIRFLTLLQIGWFLLNVSGRAVSGLTITCLELTTGAFIYCAVGITLCWIHKPADIVLPEVIATDTYIQEILCDAADRANEPYLRTPLDFVDYEEWPLSLFFQHCVQILRYMHLPMGQRIVPRMSIENTFMLPMPSTIFPHLLIVSLVYVGLFFSAWNWSFPTRTELVLWRLAIVASAVVLPVFWVMIEWTWRWYPALRKFFGWHDHDRWKMNEAPRRRYWPGHGRLARRTRSAFASCKNNLPSRNKKFDIPLKAILMLYVLGPIYCSARAYIFIADFVELRSLPRSSYTNVDWASLIPHF